MNSDQGMIYSLAVRLTPTRTASVRATLGVPHRGEKLEEKVVLIDQDGLTNPPR